jgi:ATP-dependent RNA helicase DDX5/DBP2
MRHFFSNTNGMTFTNRKFGEQTTFEARSGYTNRGGYSSAANKFGTYNGFDNESFTNGISQPLIFRQKPADETIGGRLRPVDYKKMSMKPLQKNFYREHAAVHRRDQAEIDQFIEENNITLNGPNIPRPVFEFAECHFPG